MRHVLKTVAPLWRAVADGTKPFELRKNTRAFQVGDEVIIEEVDEDTFNATGSTLTAEITYILEALEGRSFAGLLPGYCVLGLKLKAVAGDGIGT